MGSFDGKVVVILGASTEGGVGEHTAWAFAREGATVVIAARNAERLDRVARAVNAHAVSCDIAVESEVSALADQIIKKFGRLDVAINAAGQPLMASIAKTDEAMLDRSLAVHLKGPFWFIKHMARVMDKRRGGSIITISSITATLPISHHAAYVAAKAGTDHLVRVAALEYGPHQIRVNSISPGFMDTPMTSEYTQTPGLVQAFEAETPLGRIATPDDIAEACLWLAHPKAYVTGINLQVNGGAFLRRMPTQQDIGASIAKVSKDRSGK